MSPPTLAWIISTLATKPEFSGLDTFYELLKEMKISQGLRFKINTQQLVHFVNIYYLKDSQNNGRYWGKLFLYQVYKKDQTANIKQSCQNQK